MIQLAVDDSNSIGRHLLCCSIGKFTRRKYMILSRVFLLDSQDSILDNIRKIIVLVLKIFGDLNLVLILSEIFVAKISSYFVLSRFY